MKKSWIFGLLVGGIVAYGGWLGYEKMQALQENDFSAQETLYADVFNVFPLGQNVPENQEIVITFDKELVPLGAMQRESIMIEIEPKLECKWRWINRSSLGCTLDRDAKLKLATQYTISIPKRFSPQDNIALNEAYAFSFSTARPMIERSTLLLWETPTKPYLSLSFSMPVTKASLLDALKITNKDSTSLYEIELLQEKITEEDSRTTVSYDVDDSSLESAKKDWIVTSKKPLEANQDLFLKRIGALYSDAGPLPSVQEFSYSFRTFGAFEFLGVRCQTDTDERKLLRVQSSQEELSLATNACDPMSPVALAFSSPVSKKNVAHSLKLDPKLNIMIENFDPWEGGMEDEYGIYNHYEAKEYLVTLPILLKANTHYKMEIDAKNIQDMFERPLEGKNTFAFHTSHRKPNLTLGYNDIVLEKDIESDGALYATNLENIELNFIRFDAQNLEAKKPSTQEIETMDVQDIAYKTKMNIRKALGDKSGILYGNISSNSLKDASAPILAQVTPFQVHAKFGHFNTFVWVSTFADAKPVADAKVTFYYGKQKDLNKLTKLSDGTLTDAKGRATLDGRAKMEDAVSKIIANDYENQFFVHVEQGGDEALLPLDYGYSIYSSSVYPYPRALGEHANVWGTTPQGVYKRGDRVAYKIYHRDQNNTRLIVAEQKEKFELRVYDPMSTVVHESLDISLNDFGTIDGSFVIPKQGLSGTYRFELKSKSAETIWYPMYILVSDFTPAPFRVVAELDKKLYATQEEMQVSAHATMFSGGAYAHAPVRLSVTIKEESFSSEDALLKNFYFISSDYKEKTLLDVRENLDTKGEFAYKFKLDDIDIAYGSVILEASVEDERGKFVAAYAKAQYAQRDRFVGLRNSEWMYEKSKPTALEVVVVDREKKILKDVKVDVEIEYKEYRSARVKGAGNAFVTVNSSQWIKESTCSVVSSDEVQKCEFTPQNIGSYRFKATVQDSNNKPSTTEMFGWVYGAGTITWDQSNDATLEIVPQKESYKIGEKAKYLVKNPFKTTQALITVERYGVIDSWVQTFDTSTPTVEFEVKEEYLPGFYLSVVALSPRVAKPVEGIVDLGKPSYKMGYVETQVKDAAKELKVSVKSDKEVYKPREKVTLTIDVKNQLSSKKEEYELAIAVVDSSVLALNKKGANYYDIYKGFNTLESLDVQNYSLISRLIGRQNFEKKGANQGGDGGSDGLGQKSFRDDFKYIAYWNPSLEASNEKSTNVEFTLPDNLTEFKIIVLAISKKDTMGHGVSSFSCNKEIQILPIMPNQVVVGDSFDAGFSIHNSSKEKRKIDISIQAKGAASADKNITLELEAYAREKVFIPIKTLHEGNVTFNIFAKDAQESDALKYVVAVNKKASLLSMANFGSLSAHDANETIKVPKDIQTGVGSIGVALSATVIGNLDGAFVYLKEYPYWCWEQRLSKGLGAAYYIALQEYLGDALMWDNAKESTEQMLHDAASYQAPNGGMAFWIGANEYVNPYLSAYTALGFEWLKESGYKTDKAVEEKLQQYLKNFLTQQAAPKSYTKGMSATVRAVALHALAKSKTLEASDIERYFEHSKMMSLFGKAHYFQAMLLTPDVPQQHKDMLMSALLSSATQSAGRFDFSEKTEDGSLSLLESPMRTNCAVLSALMMAKKEGGFENKIADIPPKIMRTITQNRGGKNHWENTQENLFCMQAIKEYAEVYETEKVSMSVDVLLDDKKLAKATFTSKKEGVKEIKKTIELEDVGAQKTLSLKKEGSGRLYYTSHISYAPKLSNAEAINAGFEVHREYAKKEKDESWKLLSAPYKIQKGDIVRVDIYLSLASNKNFVVLSDAIAGGLEAINTDLATASMSDADMSKTKMAQGSYWYKFPSWKEYGWYASGFYHKELREESAQFYADYLYAGNYHLSYTAQAITSGEFSAMATHIEQMYDPDVFGKSLPALFVVE